MAANNYPPLFPTPTIGAPCTPHPLQPSLLTRLSDTLHGGLRTTTKEFIALCEYNINPDLSTHIQGMSGSELQAASAAVTVGIKRWQACHSGSSGTNNIYRSRTNRSSTAAKNASSRDQNRCVISLTPDPLEVAHIVPLSCFDNTNDTHQAHPAFLSLLHMFAGEETKQRVIKYLGLENTPSSTGSNLGGVTNLKINRIENLMTLTRDIHRWWDTGKIILEPVGDPLAIFAAGNDHAFLTHYDVVFSFVPSHRPPSSKAGWDPSTLIQLVPLSDLQFNEDEDPLLQEICIMRRTTRAPPLPPSTGEKGKPPVQGWKQLTTGTVIRLVTNDPGKYPLPHPDLLRLHAALSRVVRCTASAGPEMLDLAEDESPDISVVGPEEEHSILEEPVVPLTTSYALHVSTPSTGPSDNSNPTGYYYGLRNNPATAPNNYYGLRNNPATVPNTEGYSDDPSYVTPPARGLITHLVNTVPSLSSRQQEDRVREFLNSLPSPPSSSLLNSPLWVPPALTQPEIKSTQAEVGGRRKRGYIDTVVADENKRGAKGGY